MGKKDYSISKMKEHDNLIKRIHILVFFTLFFLIISQIILVAIGLGSTLCVWILIVLLLLDVILYYQKRKIHRSTKEEMQRQHDSKYEVIDLPKVYDFFCPRCLYQTNEDTELCPNCKTGRLTPTTKNRD
jgi:hypothetical protein